MSALARASVVEPNPGQLKGRRGHACAGASASHRSHTVDEVKTERSRSLAHASSPRHGWFRSQWDWLDAHGTLTNRFLLSNDGLNVKRSIFVCALLARVQNVELVSKHPIALKKLHGRITPHA